MQETGERWRLGHRPALDGLRGVAVLLVVLCHTFYSRFAGAGPVGVSVFFALSGFLITALLLAEHERAGRIDFAAFYRRRALRLFPAAAAFLVFAVVLGVAIRQPITDHLPALVLYAGNWVTATGGHLGLASHLWSLAVEEQFYIVFPLLLVAVLRRSRRTLVTLLVAGVLVSDVARLWLFHADGLQRAYAGTDTNAAGLLLGCLLAVALHRSNIRWTVPGWVAVAPLAALAPLAFLTSAAAALIVAPMIASAVAVLAIFLLMHAEAPRWLTARWLVLVGKRSYGLYLWHYPLAVLAGQFGAPWWVRLLMVAASWGVTLLSWRYVEQPFLRRRTRQESARIAAPSHQPSALPLLTMGPACAATRADVSTLL